jgi:thioredoxin reductase (NADPH)
MEGGSATTKIAAGLGDTMFDTLIIGAGPAGLTAASYLGRFRRPTMVIEAHSSRAEWIPESHNIPGFPQGIGGTQLLSALRAQALRFGAQIRTGPVESLSRTETGFVINLAGASVESRYVLLATGVRDHFPALRGAPEAVLRRLLRVCPICDGFEAIDKNIAVVGDGPRGEREALFLRTYSDRVTLLQVGDSLDPDSRTRLKSGGIRLIETPLNRLEIEENDLLLRCDDGRIQRFDVFYAALGCTPQDSLAAALGAARDRSDALMVDAHQQTSVPGLYAAGDVVRGLNQVVVAAAEAAIAATAMHNRLRTVQ